MIERRRKLAALAGITAGLAFIAGLAVGEIGAMAFVGMTAVAVAAAAFIDLRITLLAIVPVMVLLPELPLSVPIRTEDLLMVPLAAAWLGRLAIGRDTWPDTPLNRPIFAVVVIELLALLWGAYRGTAGLSPTVYSGSFFFLKTVEVSFLYFIVVTAVRSDDDTRLFAYLLCAAAAALGIWGMTERAGRAIGEAITGPAGPGGYSLLGLTFVVLLATLMSLLLTQRSRAVRALLIAAALPVTYALVFTLSRQSYVGAVAAISVLIWVRDRRLILPALAIALALPLLVPEVVQERALSIVPGASEPIGDFTPYATRVHALQTRGPEVLLRSPLLGFGPAALPPGFLDNQYLLTLYYTGVIGLAAFLWLLWSAMRTAYASYKSLTGVARGLALAWLAATAGLALAGLAGSPFVAVRVRQIYWFLAALTVAATHVAARVSGPTPQAALEEMKA